MAKKTTKKPASKRITRGQAKAKSAEKLEVALKKKGMKNAQLQRTDFGRGQFGYTLHLFGGGKDGSLVANLELIQRDDDEWRLKVELASWLEKMVKDAGFVIHERKKPERGLPEFRGKKAVKKKTPKLRVV